MEKAIYKIENLINHKIYIGQSVNPEKRWKQHCKRKKENYKSLINEAINKYGKENFSFEILGWYEDYNNKEKEFIAQYRTIVPYGYNICPGGEEPPHYNGEKHPSSKISEETAKKVIKQLKDWRIPKKTIISNNKITQDICRHINEGSSWYQEEEKYPLRPSEKVLNEYRALYVKWLCCNSDLPLNKIGEKVGWGRSSAKMINQGANHFDADLIYPIRNNKEKNKEILNQKTCIDYLHFEE